MQISFLIVTKNRPEDLKLTLNKLYALIDTSKHEVLVFIDNCKKTELIIKQFNWVNWTISSKSLSASPARHIIYQKAKGNIFIGLDDDAHPVSQDFINHVEKEFYNNNRLGILSFQEVRGFFKSDSLALAHAKLNESYFTKNFVGCGFAIKKEVYHATNGFPVWMTIYGEEPALALEVLDLEFQIFFAHHIVVNHRVDVQKRKLANRHYFRFEHQFKNAIRFYVVYFPNPILRLIKLLLHNFKKYGLSDFKFFKLYFKVCFSTIVHFFYILKHRKPVKKTTLNKILILRSLKY